MAGAAVLAYGVRGKSSQLFGPTRYRGSASRPALALTFDDGPSESTPHILHLLARFGIPATFFQCGANIRRLPAIARDVLAGGHEIGNHSDTHPALYLKSSRHIFDEFNSAQRTIVQTLGVNPGLMRAPFGARWFGFRDMQQRLALLGVMWTVIGRDWHLDGDAVARRVLSRVSNGAIVCLHDGRQLTPHPDTSSTIHAVRQIVPALIDQGYRFQTVSQLLRAPE